MQHDLSMSLLCVRLQVTGVLQQIAEAHGVNMVEGVLTHQLKQFVIDGNKCVLNKASPEYRVEDGEFEENEVYGIDMVVSPYDASLWYHLYS